MAYAHGLLLGQVRLHIRLQPVQVRLSLQRLAQHSPHDQKQQCSAWSIISMAWHGLQCVSFNESATDLGHRHSWRLMLTCGDGKYHVNASGCNIISGYLHLQDSGQGRPAMNTRMPCARACMLSHI